MKILVCTDGSAQSQKAVEIASIIARGCNAKEVAVIHVCDFKQDLQPLLYKSSTYENQTEEIKRTIMKHRGEKTRKIFQKAVNIFEEKNIKVDKIFEQGHPAKVILDVASEKGFDMIFIGSRGLGGWKKRILGSVSSAVVQEAKNISVVVVKQDYN